MENQKLWGLMRSLSQQLMAQYETPMEKAASSIGLEPSECFSVILPAYMFEPDPISAERLRKRSPYNSLSYYQKPLSSVYASGYLNIASEGGYRLNAKGHDAYTEIMKAAYVALEEIALFSPEESEVLITLLGKLVQASINANDQPNKWCILHSRRLYSGQETAPIITIDQYISDLAAYRDDAHTASWAGYAISALAWDIFSLLWRGFASSISEINAKTSKRGWTEQETLEAIEELIVKGWVEGLTLSKKGKSVREKAEKITDQYFLSPWACLSFEESEQLSQMLIPFSGAN